MNFFIVNQEKIQSNFLLYFTYTAVHKNISKKIFLKNIFNENLSKYGIINLGGQHAARNMLVPKIF